MKPLVNREFPGLILRGRVYQFRKAIPERLRSVIGKREFVRSLQTSRFEEAISRYRGVSVEFDNLVRNAREGRRPDQEQLSFEELAVMAKAMKLNYRPASETKATQNLEEFLKQFRVWEERGQPAGGPFKAIFGEADRVTKLSQLLDNYIYQTRDERRTLNEREVKKKLNTLRRAIRDFISFANRDDLSGVTPSIAHSYLDHLKDRVTRGEIKPNTANKILGHLRSLIDHAIERGNYVDDNPFVGRRLKGDPGKRSAYSTSFIRDVILAPGGLDGLDDVCQALVWAMIDTGAHLAELCGLDPVTDIRLDDDIPHIIIQPNQHRRLKNNARSRKIPLIGLALRALQKYPHGFEKYRRPLGPEAASANINKYIQSRGLIEPRMFINGQNSPQTTYSFRHMFKDRLRSHHIVEGTQNHLMGHSTPGIGAHYGHGYDLRTLRDALTPLQVDFDPPLQTPKV